MRPVTLRLACIDADAPPLFTPRHADSTRKGFEPDVAQLLADQLELALEWVYLPWAEMIPAAQAGHVDAVLCGQGITPTRQALVDFTTPYAVFHEGVLVRRGSGITSPVDLAGRYVGAISESTNMALAETFTSAITVAFGGSSDDVFAEMLQALIDFRVDAVVDDDVVFVPMTDHPDFELAFTVKTGNRWGLAVSKGRPDILQALDEALHAVIADGRHLDVWQRWLSGLEYPFATQAPTSS